MEEDYYMENSSWNNANREETDTSNAFTGTAKFCPNCGERIPEAASFCPYCGFKFEGILSGNEPEPEETTVLKDQSFDSSYESDSSLLSGGTSQHLYEYEADRYDNSFDNQTQTPKKKSVIPIIAIVSAAVAALLLGFFVLAPLLTMKIEPDSSQTNTVETMPAASPDESKTETASEETSTTSAAAAATTSAAATTTSAETTTASAAATTASVATPTPIPTATSTPIPTATPTEVPPQTISQPNIIDASTGQPISIPNDTAESFAYPDSGSRVWSYGDVNGMTAGQVRYCINEIYAKHGYIFQNENWLNYFKQKTWYSPTVPKASFGDQYLNANEVANVKLLNQYYADRKFPDY